MNLSVEIIIKLSKVQFAVQRRYGSFQALQQRGGEGSQPGELQMDVGRVARICNAHESLLYSLMISPCR